MSPDERVSHVAHMGSGDFNRVGTTDAIHEIVCLIYDHNIAFQLQTD